jgi:tripartite-type tricarboxylate transporter receptor subunit TctC
VNSRRHLFSLSSFAAVITGLLFALCFVNTTRAQSSAAAATTYPTKPVKIVVGYAAGGAVDLVARSVGQSLSTRLGQSFIVDNKPGAGTNIAVKSVIDASADGYKLLMTANALAANMSLYQPMPFDAEKDLVPIALIGRVPVVIAANPSVPYDDIKKLIAVAKSNPGGIGYATPGNGSTPHMAMELFARAAGITLQHVPYRGGAPAMNDVLGGQIPLIAINAMEALPQAKGGKLKVLAVMSPMRSALFPNAPTIAESGFSGFEASVWYGLLAPAATPHAIVAKLHAEVEQALQTKEVQARMNAVGGEIILGSSEQFGALIHSERVRYAKLVKDAHIKPD